MRSLKIVASAALLALPGAVHAAEPPCLTRAEFSGLAAYALPSVMRGANARCEPALGPGAYLSTKGDRLVERYEARKDANWPMAKAAFLKIDGKGTDKTNGILKLLPDDTQQEMFDQILEALVVQEIPTEQCGTIDEFARLLAPLPAQNMAELLTLIVALAGKPGKKAGGKSPIGKLSLCPDKS